ncbi:hypothetical protein [Nocardioides houyundeii]|uniref:hypothetical protein n=1 Tax=Nocardioides houyundeii TaxID=2045452 RepID=UPI0013B3D52F|nr:hypothetical protein [Nocardioides houyundeii]
MASISTGKPAADGTPRYVVNYRDTADRQRRKTFARKAEAVAFANTVEADKLHGTYLDVDDDGLDGPGGDLPPRHLLQRLRDPVRRS